MARPISKCWNNIVGHLFEDLIRMVFWRPARLWQPQTLLIPDKTWDLSIVTIICNDIELAERYYGLVKIAYSDGGDHQSLVLEALHNLGVGLCEISREVHPVLQAPGPNLSQNFYLKLRRDNTVYYHKMAWLIQGAAWLIRIRCSSLGCFVAQTVTGRHGVTLFVMILLLHVIWPIAKYKLIDAVRRARVRISDLRLRGGPLPSGSHETTRGY